MTENRRRRHVERSPNNLIAVPVVGEPEEILVRPLSLSGPALSVFFRGELVRWLGHPRLLIPIEATAPRKDC
ncbi:MAG TPA: hypothetical protein VIW92_10035, partial [Thermoanaerobaculia bacterium]